MKVLVIGSMNLDYVFQVDHTVATGETESATTMGVFVGGKGINQSVALVKAGVQVYLGGAVGEDGQPFFDVCKEYDVNSDYICRTKGKTGHTFIQIDKDTKNSLIVYGGANLQLTKEYIDDTLAQFSKGDMIVLQNEVNLLPYIVDRASEKGMTVVMNPSPFNSKLDDVDLHKVDIFFLNELEGMQMTGTDVPNEMLDVLIKEYPGAKTVLTLGEEGAIYADANQRIKEPAFPVKAIDTIAAGDTFTGYFLAGLVEGMDISDILKMSAKASAIAVSRNGAVPSIPYRHELNDL